MSEGRSRRRLLVGLSVLALSPGLQACGASSNKGGSVSNARASAQQSGSTDGAAARRESLAAPVAGDGDGDSPERTAFDSDDFHSMHFGHAADRADEETIAAIVKRYYTALGAEDAPTVCSLLLEVVAESLPEDDHGGSETQQLPPRRQTCASAVSPVLAESHRSLLAEAKSLRVIGVRVRRRRASALLRFGGTSARHILLYKEEGKWKLGTLADEDLG